MNHYEIIDMGSWKRAVHCAVFRDSVEPAFCVTFELDITRFLKRVKELHYSFTMSMIYAVTECANEIEESAAVLWMDRPCYSTGSIPLSPIWIRRQSSLKW